MDILVAINADAGGLPCQSSAGSTDSLFARYFDDTGQHNKPHVHVFYGGDEAVVGIDGELLAGKMPAKQFKLVSAWLVLHEDEAYRAWNNAVANKPFDKIAPLS